MKIKVYRIGNEVDWRAELIGSGVYGGGKSPAEAIGNLFLFENKRIGAVVEVDETPPSATT